jgi:hypothetical protein
VRWPADLVSDPGATVEGHAGHVAAGALLALVWLFGVYRGARPLTFEGLLAETSVGLAAVLLAAARASAGDAPAALGWLSAPYMAAALAALALAHLRAVEIDTRRPFVAGWALWTGGSLLAIAALVALTNAVEPPPPDRMLHALGVAGAALGVAVLFVFSPFIIAFLFLVDLVVGLLPASVEPPELPERPEGLPGEEQPDEAGSPALWARALAYALLSGAVTLLALGALVALWFAFRRLRPDHAAEDELREAFEPAAGAPGAVRSLLSDAFGRLRGRAAGRDAIGRLYVAMVRRAAADGLARAPAATPHEFAARLQAHFASPAPVAISEAYARARYAARPPAPDELDRLRRDWRALSRS